LGVTSAPFLKIRTLTGVLPSDWNFTTSR